VTGKQETISRDKQESSNALLKTQSK